MPVTHAFILDTIPVMNNWFCSNLGDPLLADPLLERIRSLYRARYGNPADLNTRAVFMRHETGGRLHCEVLVYFSPDSTEIARATGATPCAKPLPAGLTILAGPNEAWSALFTASDIQE